MFLYMHVYNQFPGGIRRYVFFYFFQIFQTKDIQQERLDHIKRTCETNRLGHAYSPSSFFQKLNYNIQLYDPLGFLYCRIQKVGSTFLQKTINHAFSGIKHLSQRGNTMLVNRSKDFVDCLPKTSKFMFVREPYGRALSGYVDKLFAPNPFFWSSVGRHIVKIVRGLFNASDLSLRCGHDVTFPEFMEYVNIAQTTLKHRDRHFFPMYEHCFPCDIKYNFIGKMETFREDVSRLFDAFESTFSVSMSFKDFEKESDLATAKSHIGRLFSFKRKTLLCEPFHKSLLRLWRDLQIRGVLPIDAILPFDSEQAKTVTDLQVTEVVTSVIQNVQNRTMLKKQRNEAKLEAFSQLSEKLIEDYKNLYHLDFELFDYQTDPTFVKNRISLSSKNLKYFNIF